MPPKIEQTDKNADSKSADSKRLPNSSVRPLDVSKQNLEEEWGNWKMQFTIFLKAAALEGEANDRKVALLLHYLGSSVLPIFSSFQLDLQTVQYEALLEKFQDHFAPRKNVTMSRFAFFNRKQLENETIDQYVTELVNLAASCEFADLKNSIVKDVMITNLKETYIKEKLLMEDPADLAKAVKMAQAMVASKDQASIMTHDIDINTVRNSGEAKQMRSGGAKKRSGLSDGGSKTKKTCGYCGTSHQPRKCPAYSKTCDKCGKRNHFAIVCRQRDVNKIDAGQFESDEEEFFVGQIEVNHSAQPGTWYEVLTVNNCRVRCQIDTGAQVNVMSKTTFRNIGYELSQLAASRSKLKTLAGYLPSLGRCVIPCTFQSKVFHFTFFVVDMECQTLISLKGAEQMGLVNRIEAVSIENYSDLFKGLGCIKGVKVTLDVDPKVRPKIDPPRRVPIKLRGRFRSELERMLKLGVVKKVDKPTSWVSSVVVVEKGNDKVRVCIDPRNLNEAILRPRRYIPQLEEIKAELSNSVVFSTLDANSGFWVLPLDEKSSDLTCFNTPFGRYQFLRLPYGISASSEIFQNVLSDLFGDIPGVIIYIDDFLVYGKTQEEHDERLRLVLERARKVGLKFNKAKCQIGKSSVKYLGHIFGTQGVSIDPSRIEAINKMESPRSKVELQRFLGMINYISSFIKNLSMENSNLRKLLKVNLPWEWNESLEAEFQNLKKIICQAPVLKYFDPTKPVKLSVDSSSNALGAVILQEGLPVAYASSTLSECQTRWAQIEKEMLAIWFACQKFNSYLYGQDDITVETDHKPLVTIFKKDFDNIPSRLQRLMLKLYKYNLNVVYTPGKEMFISDTLSRAKYLDGCMNDSAMIDKQLNFQVNLLFTGLAVSEEKLKQIQVATTCDESMQCLKMYCDQGWPSSKNKCNDLAKPYFHVRDELSVNRDIVFRGSRIVIPASLRKDMTEKIHEGHFGFEKCYKLARDVLYWPNLSSDVKNKVESCEICLKNKKNNVKQPLLQHEPVLIPFGKVAIDLADFEKKKLLVVVDYFSGYFEFSFLNSTNATTVIQHLKAIFARWGIPFEVFSDNGQPFASSEFRCFAKDWGFKVTTSSPNFPRSNGLIERTIQTVKKILSKARDAKTDHFMALLKYRTTSKHSLYSPSQLLMSRNLRTNLPCTEDYLMPHVVDLKKHSAAVEQYRMKMKTYYDRNAHSLPDLKLGEEGFFKKQPHLPWSPCKIVAECDEPRSYLVKHGEGIYRRNREHIIVSKTLAADGQLQGTPVRPVQPLAGHQHQPVASEPLPGADTQPEGTQPQTTNCGRRVVPPKRFTFSDYP